MSVTTAAFRERANRRLGPDLVDREGGKAQGRGAGELGRLDPCPHGTWNCRFGLDALSHRRRLPLSVVAAALSCLYPSHAPKNPSVHAVFRSLGGNLDKTERGEPASAGAEDVVPPPVKFCVGQRHKRHRARWCPLASSTIPHWPDKARLAKPLESPNSRLPLPPAATSPNEKIAFCDCDDGVLLHTQHRAFRAPPAKP